MKEPNIRFNEFKGEWKTSFVSEVCNISTGKSNTQDKIEDGEYPFYVRSPYVERSNKYLYDEEAVLTVGDGVGTGKVFHYVNGKYDLHQRVYRMFDFHNIHAKYFYYLFSTKFYKRVMSMTAKSSVDSVRMDMIADMKIDVPVISEQHSIASFFTTLDAQISTSTSRLASLKQIKAASLQAMFPQEGETVPKIRFKGFEGEWEYDEIGNICKITTGKSNTQDQVPDGQYPFFIRSEKIAKSVKYLYDTEAVITIGDGNIGKVFHYTKGKFDLHQRCYMMYEFQSIIDAKYFYYYFSTHFYDRAIKMSAKATVDSVRLDMIAKMEIKYPSFNEQRAIASYFTNLDRQITLQSQRLEKLKQIKAACLDKMFV